MHLYSGPGRVTASYSRIRLSPAPSSSVRQTLAPGRRAAATANGGLLITFEGGTGIAVSIGQRKVIFICHVPLRAGQKLGGYVLMPRTAERSSAAGSYLAKVTRVRPAADGASFEVTARFLWPRTES
ncbi:MAG TPA: hypothetical protein VNS22_20485 [Geminicoccus sp.]|uniref:hypothetical protein n=1 Tax=Geminicoccus sp. TaxID=2024832 RepID=UPI002C70E555|nr:hypothetical protein [Geminicoccus sp.]HWL70736.1 hypothetical protein [Geminicoccus sp.]